MSRGGQETKDVIIIGSGVSAFCAAIESCRSGAKVAILEKDESLGGTSIVSGGGCFVVGSPLQESTGIHDSPDDAFEDWIKWARGTADEHWARFYIEHSLHDLYFWTEKLGVRWVDMKPQEGNRVDRWHRCENNGLGLMEAIMREARKSGLKEIYPNTLVTEIVMQNERAIGIRCIDRSIGQTREMRGKTVVVAAGGFCSNRDMIYEVRPDLRDSKIMEGSGLGATGNGHRLLTQAGAYMTHLENLWFYIYATPDYRDPQDRRGLVFRWTPGYIWVNQQGRRFCNESLSGGASGTPALMSQSPKHAWAILDTPMTSSMEVADPYYRKGDRILRDKVQELLDNSPYICKADSLEELARKIEVPVSTFLSTVKKYNLSCDQGLKRDPEFGKPLKDLKSFDTSPFYAIQIFPLARKNLGGVKTDLRCRVLNRHFEPIRGLYACGEVAGMAGGHINGVFALEGTMLGPSLISGRVAGAWAAAEGGYGSGLSGNRFASRSRINRRQPDCIDRCCCNHGKNVGNFFTYGNGRGKAKVFRGIAVEMEMSFERAKQAR